MNIQEGLFWLILTVFLEARDQSPVGQGNIVKIVLNRAEQRNWKLQDIVFARKQFSCYNNGLKKAMEPVAAEFFVIPRVTTTVLQAVKEWESGDRLLNATHYFNPKLVPGGWPASWDRDKMVVVDTQEDHIFLREI